MAGTPSEFEYCRGISVSGYFTEVDNLTNNERLDAYVGNLKEITKRHWKPPNNRPDCTNRQCRKRFSTILERPHHCRRCGQLFCSACLQFRRRLNMLAHFDLDGQLYEVCQSCFEMDQITDGQVNRHTEDFKLLRSRFRNHPETSQTNVFKSAVSLETECDRLIQGFASSVGKSEIKRTLHEMTSMVSTPTWMKSSIWLQANMASKCYVCQGNFGITKAKKFCHLCGLSVCKNCSSQDLLIYFPDNDHKAVGLPKLAVIKIIGGPEVEPEISLYLRVCTTCKDWLIERQLSAVEEEADAVDLDANFLDMLHRLDLKLQKSEEGVKRHLPNYTDVVDSLEDGSGKTPAQSNTKTLAKAQGDLADALAHHVTTVQQLKKLSPKSEKQAQLLKNYIRAKCEFYMDNMSVFRSLKEKLTRAVPVESLDFIQKIVDKNAIISTHLYLRQLVYEVLLLSERHSIVDDLPNFLVHVEQEIEGEVKQSLILGKENVDEHLELVKEMIRSRIKEHKLIKLSQRNIKHQGTKYVFDCMLKRTEDILNQVNNQLQVISASRSFPAGKKALEMALDGVKKKKTDEEDFHFVSQVI